MTITRGWRVLHSVKKEPGDMQTTHLGIFAGRFFSCYCYYFGSVLGLGFGVPALRPCWSASIPAYAFVVPHNTASGADFLKSGAMLLSVRQLGCVSLGAAVGALIWFVGMV